MATYCALCGKKIGYGEPFSEVNTGFGFITLCGQCNEEASFVADNSHWDDPELSEELSKNIDLLNNKLPACTDSKAKAYLEKIMLAKEHQDQVRLAFDETDDIIDIDGVFKINNTKKSFAALDRGNYYSLHKFEELDDFSIEEDGQSITSGRSGSAAVGALLFGVTGAILGSAGSKTTKQVVQNLDIVLSFKGLNAQIETIHFLRRPAQKGSDAYVKAAQTCKRVASALKQIMDSVKQPGSDLLEAPAERGKGVAIYAFSVADEILKFKGLLDQGIITAEEFEAQKQKLLALEY